MCGCRKLRQNHFKLFILNKITKIRNSTYEKVRASCNGGNARPHSNYYIGVLGSLFKFKSFFWSTKGSSRPNIIHVVHLLRQQRRPYQTASKLAYLSNFICEQVRSVRRFTQLVEQSTRPRNPV